MPSGDVKVGLEVKAFDRGFQTAHLRFSGTYKQWLGLIATFENDTSYEGALIFGVTQFEKALRLLMGANSFVSIQIDKRQLLQIMAVMEYKKYFSKFGQNWGLEQSFLTSSPIIILNNKKPIQIEIIKKDTGAAEDYSIDIPF